MATKEWLLPGYASGIPAVTVTQEVWCKYELETNSPDFHLRENEHIKQERKRQLVLRAKSFTRVKNILIMCDSILARMLYD